MKRTPLLLLVIFALLFYVAPAHAALKSVSVTPLAQLAVIPTGDDVAGMLVAGKFIYIYGTSGSNAFVRSIDGQGVVNWTLSLDTGADEISTAVTRDTAGNIWVFGSASKTSGVSPTPSQTPSASASTMTSLLNPDGVVLDPEVALRNDLNTLVAWKVSPTGVLLSTFTTDFGQPVLARAAVESLGTVSVVGLTTTTMGSVGFFVQSDAIGNFAKPLFIGKADTDINSLAKRSDGSFVLAGASSEVLGGKSLKGVRDGVIVRIVKNKIVSVVRSSNIKATRSWQNTSNSLFFGGSAAASGKNEAVATKFAVNANGVVPTWTVRFPAQGPAITTDVSATSHAMTFSSISAIPGVVGWKPSKGQTVTLIYDAKWAVKGAYSSLLLSNPIDAGFSNDLGLVVLESGAFGVSIFHALTR
ncbi:unannotated protein [freshwater metagenome]|uniref:Unannotated protein n=1 Tax=freshwater metagenome TaxID=449393 RepID=A0A6J5Z0C8_9ZZZZ|nr:hypothetical protein [Actinomycetota bacterium]MSW25749.1 hypothetical protein [Actinomycetota bacterium]MSW33481.1 hypothetical protein [Actinomycetota bacterium]MSX30505.1 hypothetical protein [Actinomycetota bacterium]MSX51053.1 hypothetical protein [Actinomycetota bacterium]